MGGTRRAASLALVSMTVAAGISAAAPATASSTTRTYYVSATGNDSQSGTSPASAWRTLGPVNARALAGDTVLLEGGSTFVGPLDLNAQDSGVRISSFGSGRARLVGQGSPGIDAVDAGAVAVQNLDVTGDNVAFTRAAGLSFYNDQPAGRRLAGPRVSDVTVSGFQAGVKIGGANPGAGFAHVSITGVKADGNRDDGIITYGPAFDAQAPSYANADVTVLGSSADGNLGNPADTVHNSGNGIVLGSVDGGAILRSSAQGNGARCTAPEGPAGIWTYDSRRIRIAEDTARGNQTGGTADGDGFDLDQNVSDSVLEQNVSSGNDGAGYLVYSGQQNSANSGNVVRGNVSVGDAQTSDWYGGLTLAGRVIHVVVRHNRIDTRRSASHAPALAIKPGVRGVTIRDNSWKSAPHFSVVVSPRITRAQASISRNVWATKSAQRVQWGSVGYPSVAAWTKATGES